MSYTYPTGVASLLKAEGFGAEFIRVVMTVAEKYEGLRDLLVMWANEGVAEERTKNMHAIKEVVKDCLVPETDSPERTCEKCGATGAMGDMMATWRCRSCNFKWTSSVWTNEPREVKRSFPEWHEYLLRIEGFPADYVKRLIFHAGESGELRSLLDKWAHGKSSEERGVDMLSIDNLLKAVSK
jgi:ribosomal protein L37AE/L43A